MLNPYRTATMNQTGVTTNPRIANNTVAVAAATRTHTHRKCTHRPRDDPPTATPDRRTRALPPPLPPPRPIAHEAGEYVGEVALSQVKLALLLPDLPRASAASASARWRSRVRLALQASRLTSRNARRDWGLAGHPPGNREAVTAFGGLAIIMSNPINGLVTEWFSVIRAEPCRFRIVA